jgi:GNAT superfamily N-acetyltransferase
MVKNPLLSSCNFVAIDDQNIGFLINFLKIAGSSSKSFRYFKTPLVSVRKGHIITLLLKCVDRFAAYGQLDNENSTVRWGMMVAECDTGMGFGKLILEKLLSEAREKAIQSIQLTADNDNEAAIKLYTNYGFRVFSKREKISYYTLDLT